MGDLFLNLNEPPNEDGFQHYVLLMKDQKTICRIKCRSPSIEMPAVWNISDIVRTENNDHLLGLSKFFLRPASENSHQRKEWGLFLGFLRKSRKVAIGKTDLLEFYILPPHENSNLSHAVALYKMEITHNVYHQKHGRSEIIKANKTCKGVRPSMESTNPCLHGRLPSFTGDSTLSNLRMIEDKCSPDCKLQEAIGDHYAHELRVETCSISEPKAVGENGPMEKNFMQADPSYLKTLSHIHSGWVFGAVAELVDNSRDAKATKLEISIDVIYSKDAGKDIPMLSVIDDGHGMTHQEIVRMISLGHKQPDADDPERIGRFGTGFKTGAMRLGNDAFVLTQTANSRSIAFLSQSLNEGKDNLEIPIVSYRRKGKSMEVDTSVQTEALTKYNLKAIKEFSPFNKYLIGEKAGLFWEKGTGTQIYIWNLDKWGSSYCLEWNTGMSGGSSFHQGDILIRSRRSRTRTGQMTRMVPLDFSLRSYLEVIFLDPRMKIYVQGSLVKSRPLAKSLNTTVVENCIIMGKPVQLTLGCCQLEWEQANCGIFLYWHGRLIEAYKRVGGMLHNGEKSHGIIGVTDVTDLMNDNGCVWVLNNKQGFQDCEVYAQLEEWLGKRADEYLDNYFDKLQVKKGSSLYKPDHEWVQCDKCRKWRMLSSGFNSKMLSQEWFCYMKPFDGECETPEQKVERGVITVSTKRSGYDPRESLVERKEGLIGNASCTSEGGSDEDSNQTLEEYVRLPSLKRLRRGPSRTCKK